jgi:hypothetical protein
MANVQLPEAQPLMSPQGQPQQQPAQQPEQQTLPAQPADASTQVDSDQARWQKMVQGPFANISQQNQKPKQAGFSSASLRQELRSAMDEGRFGPGSKRSPGRPE